NAVILKYAWEVRSKGGPFSLNPGGAGVFANYLIIDTIASEGYPTLQSRIEQRMLWWSKWKE
ncbi:MAG: hypothetical protein LBQ30_10950, partial [Treponema sp.]|nr:hypothetical protein [Treponema sp.]